MSWIRNVLNRLLFLDSFDEDFFDEEFNYSLNAKPKYDWKFLIRRRILSVQVLGLKTFGMKSSMGNLGDGILFKIKDEKSPKEKFSGDLLFKDFF